VEGSGAQPLDGERKTVTALFADIKGSMDLIEDIDPVEARAIVDPALKRMIDAVHHYDGPVPNDGYVPTTLSNIPAFGPMDAPDYLTLLFPTPKLSVLRYRDVDIFIFRRCNGAAVPHQLGMPAPRTRDDFLRVERLLEG